MNVEFKFKRESLNLFLIDKTFNFCHILKETLNL